MGEIEEGARPAARIAGRAPVIEWAQLIGGLADGWTCPVPGRQQSGWLPVTLVSGRPEVFHDDLEHLAAVDLINRAKQCWEHYSVLSGLGPEPGDHEGHFAYQCTASLPGARPLPPELAAFLARVEEPPAATGDANVQLWHELAEHLGRYRRET